MLRITELVHNPNWACNGVKLLINFTSDIVNFKKKRLLSYMSMYLHSMSKATYTGGPMTN